MVVAQVVLELVVVVLVVLVVVRLEVVVHMVLVGGSTVGAGCDSTGLAGSTGCACVAIVLLVRYLELKTFRYM